jgi:hypothetical protein
LQHAFSVQQEPAANATPGIASAKAAPISLNLIISNSVD